MNRTTVPNLIPRNLPASGAPPAPLEWQNPTLRLGLFFAAHIPLALLMASYPALGMLHAYVTLAVGLWWAASENSLEQVAAVAAYITGAEVLWRMTEAGIFWEFGKYALSLTLLVALLRARLLRGPVQAFAYFALLLPSLVLPLANVDDATLRDQVSFNLSGPFALMVSVWFFWHVRLTSAQLQRVFISLIAPLVGIMTLIMAGIWRATRLSFSNESNFQTSGGFGPNQVAAALGLGALAALLLLLKGRSPWGLRVLLLAALALCVAFSALTFSRSGLYSAAIGALGAGFFLLHNARAFAKLVVVIVLLLATVNFLALPQLDSFTGGALSRRFEDVSLTGRDRIMLDDLRTWNDHPLFGVGPGQSSRYHTFHGASAHTEFTRLLAEHGALGCTALLMIFMLAVQNLRRARSAKGRALSAGMTAWSFAFMIATAMRLVAPAFAFGFAAVTLLDEEAEPPPSAAPAPPNSFVLARPYFRR